MNGGSGSGGFYKYRCKYFYTYNCANWVYVSNAPCAACLAEGRESAEAPVQRWEHRPREIQVPYVDENGVLQYSLMELITDRDPSGLYWAIQNKAAAAAHNNPQQQGGLYRMPATTSDQPPAPSYATAVPARA